MRNPYGIAIAYTQLGTLNKRLKRFDKALNYYQRALEILQQSQDWHTTSIIMKEIGNVLEYQGKWQKATSFYIKALVIDQQHNKDWLTQDIQTLGQILKNCREIQFQKLQKQVTGKNCPQELFSAIQVASEGNKD